MIIQDKKFSGCKAKLWLLREYKSTFVVHFCIFAALNPTFQLAQFSTLQARLRSENFLCLWNWVWTEKIKIVFVHPIEFTVPVSFQVYEVPLHLLWPSGTPTPSPSRWCSALPCWWCSSQSGSLGEAQHQCSPGCRSGQYCPDSKQNRTPTHQSLRLQYVLFMSFDMHKWSIYVPIRGSRPQGTGSS